jgi:hypothetical protein
MNGETTGPLVRGRVRPRPASAPVGASILGCLALLLSACSDANPAAAPAAASPRSSRSAAPGVVPAVTPGPGCPATGTAVTGAAELTRALATAAPGTTILLAPGTYSGHFVARASGTEQAPITLCGTAGAVLDGGGTRSGYVLHLDGASWWRVTGITVQMGQKGVVTDHAGHVVLSGLQVHDIGDEAVHLRSSSSDDTVEGLVIRRTGLVNARFGEGIYVGSARSNWCAYSACAPDTSDRDTIRGNDISETPAENIDVKEGTTGGVLAGNRLSGVGMDASAATAWVNVKGNAWTITGNVGSTSIGDGFQVHQIVHGWGLGNVFQGNTANVEGPGYGFYAQRRSLHTQIACDNVANGAQAGLSNMGCS